MLCRPACSILSGPEVRLHIRSDRFVRGEGPRACIKALCYGGRSIICIIPSSAPAGDLRLPGGGVGGPALGGERHIPP